MKNGMHVDEYGDKRWYKDDKRHREDGPAVIYANGTKIWYNDGMWHREDGPAIEHADGTTGWFLNDIEYSFDDWLEALDASDGDKLFLKLKWT